MTVRKSQSTYARNFNDEPDWYTISGTEIYLSTAVDPEIQWTATVCTSCNRPSVWRGESVIFPRTSSVPAPHPDMPSLAAELYEEARSVLPDSRRAAAALARASLEALLKDLDDSGGRKNLQTRIGELHGRINGSLWRVLTAIRVVGNDALHDEEDDLVVMYLSGEASSIVEPLFGAINALVEELITLPRRADELYAMIPEAKRDAAERARPKPG